MLTRLMMLGPPGAGKGTQAQLLSNKLGIPQISTGDMLRAAKAAGTELGKKAAEYMSRGDLVPDEVVVGIVKDRLAEDDTADGFILDGFPRTLVQAEALADAQVSLDAVIDVVVPEELLIERITGRMSCASCKQVYHKTFNPPETEGVCDKCGHTEFNVRADDTREVVVSRLGSYRAKTEPLRTYYADQGLLKEVDGVGEVDEVQARVLALLSEGKG
ncbi:MAG: adenylate kinase [Myxococcales bacterium]|nr:adenylate kinase [Myxococcales bacterium]